MRGRRSLRKMKEFKNKEAKPTFETGPALTTWSAPFLDLFLDIYTKAVQDMLRMDS